MPGEWSENRSPGSDPSRVLMFFFSRRGILLGLDREPPPDGDRSRTGRGGSHARGRLPPRARASVPRGLRRCAHHLAGACSSSDMRRAALRSAATAPAADWTLALAGELKRAGRRTARLPPGSSRPGQISRCRGRRSQSKSAVDPLIHKEYLEELAHAYLPKGVDRKDPRLSPLYADLKGLPPTLIQVGWGRDTTRQLGPLRRCSRRRRR